MKHLKDILIGVLVGYVVIDVLLSFLAAKRHPSLLERVMSGLGEDNVLMAVVLGVLGGFIAWYVAKSSKEMYTPIQVETETETVVTDDF